MEHGLHIDYSINPAQIVGWIVAVGVLLWKLSAWVAEMRQLMVAFRRHEELDDRRYQETRTHIHGVRDVLQVVRGESGRASAVLEEMRGEVADLRESLQPRRPERDKS